MSTAAPTQGQHLDTAREDPRWSFSNALRSEVAKMTTLRSTFVMSALMIVISVAFSALIAASWLEVEERADAAALYAASVGSSVSFAQLVIGVLAVLTVSNEYSTNMIQSTLASSPKRTPVLAAKLIVVTTTTLVLSLLSSVLGYLAASAIFGAQGLTASILDPEVIGAIAGSAVYLVAVALFAAAAASIVRHSAAGIAIVAGIFFVLPVVGQLVSLGDFRPTDYFLSNAAQTVSSSLWQTGIAEVPLNALIMVVWIVVPALIAFVLLKRRDA